MKIIAIRVAGILLCAFVALQAFGFFATYCAWGCGFDRVMLVVTTVFFVALLGALYFIVRTIMSVIHTVRCKNLKS